MTEGPTNPAHGGRLVDLVVTSAEAEALREQASRLPAVKLNSRTLSDLELLAIGGYSPLEGFMTQADYRSVVEGMHLADGIPWPMPITLAVDKDEALTIPSDGDEIALTDESGKILATMQVREKYDYDKHVEAASVYRTEDEAHPRRRRALRAGRLPDRRAGEGARSPRT